MDGARKWTAVRRRRGGEGEMGLALDRHVEGRTVRLVVSGEVDLTVSARLRAAILESLGDGIGTVVVDLDGVTFLDSTGIAAIVAGRNAALARNAALRLANPRARVRRSLEVTGVLDVLGCP